MILKKFIVFWIKVIINYFLIKFLKSFVFFEGRRGLIYFVCVKLIFLFFLKLFLNCLYILLLYIFFVIFNEFVFFIIYFGFYLLIGSIVFINY